MGTMGLALLLKPLMTAVFFCFVYWVAWVFWKLIPDCKFKRILFSPIGKKQPARNTHWSRQTLDDVLVKEPHHSGAGR
jgi:hypothetical protein